MERQPLCLIRMPREQTQDEVVSALEDLVEQARAGRVRAVCGVVIHEDHTWGDYYAGHLTQEQIIAHFQRLALEQQLQWMAEDGTLSTITGE